MADNKKKICHLLSFLVILTYLWKASATNIDCSGKSFHCINATHFMICVDLGAGVSKTVDDYVIQCPSSTVCSESNFFECEYQLSTTTESITRPSDEMNKFDINTQVTNVTPSPTTTVSGPFTDYLSKLNDTMHSMLTSTDHNTLADTFSSIISTKNFNTENVTMNTPFSSLSLTTLDSVVKSTEQTTATKNLEDNTSFITNTIADEAFVTEFDFISTLPLVADVPTSKGTVTVQPLITSTNDAETLLTKSDDSSGLLKLLTNKELFHESTSNTSHSSAKFNNAPTRSSIPVSYDSVTELEFVPLEETRKNPVLKETFNLDRTLLERIIETPTESYDFFNAPIKEIPRTADENILKIKSENSTGTETFSPLDQTTLVPFLDSIPTTKIELITPSFLTTLKSDVIETKYVTTSKDANDAESTVLNKMKNITMTQNQLGLTPTVSTIGDTFTSEADANIKLQSTETIASGNILTNSSSEPEFFEVLINNTLIPELNSSAENFIDENVQDIRLTETDTLLSTVPSRVNITDNNFTTNLKSINLLSNTSLSVTTLENENKSTKKVPVKNTVFLTEMEAFNKSSNVVMSSIDEAFTTQFDPTFTLAAYDRVSTSEVELQNTGTNLAESLLRNSSGTFGLPTTEYYFQDRTTIEKPQHIISKIIFERETSSNIVNEKNITHTPLSPKGHENEASEGKFNSNDFSKTDTQNATNPYYTIFSTSTLSPSSDMLNFTKIIQITDVNEKVSTESLKMTNSTQADEFQILDEIYYSDQTSSITESQSTISPSISFFLGQTMYEKTTAYVYPDDGVKSTTNISTSTVELQNTDTNVEESLLRNSNGTLALPTTEYIFQDRTTMEKPQHIISKTIFERKTSSNIVNEKNITHATRMRPEVNENETTDSKFNRNDFSNTDAHNATNPYFTNVSTTTLPPSSNILDFAKIIQITHVNEEASTESLKMTNSTQADEFLILGEIYYLDTSRTEGQPTTSPSTSTFSEQTIYEKPTAYPDDDIKFTTHVSTSTAELQNTDTNVAESLLRNSSGLPTTEYIYQEPTTLEKPQHVISKIFFEGEASSNIVDKKTHAPAMTPEVDENGTSDSKFMNTTLYDVTEVTRKDFSETDAQNATNYSYTNFSTSTLLPLTEMLNFAQLIQINTANEEASTESLKMTNSSQGDEFPTLGEIYYSDETTFITAGQSTRSPSTSTILGQTIYDKTTAHVYSDDGEKYSGGKSTKDVSVLTKTTETMIYENFRTNQDRILTVPHTTSISTNKMDITDQLESTEKNIELLRDRISTTPFPSRTEETVPKYPPEVNTSNESIKIESNFNKTCKSKYTDALPNIVLTELTSEQVFNINITTLSNMNEFTALTDSSTDATNISSRDHNIDRKLFTQEPIDTKATEILSVTAKVISNVSSSTIPTVLLMGETIQQINTGNPPTVYKKAIFNAATQRSISMKKNEVVTERATLSIGLLLRDTNIPDVKIADGKPSTNNANHSMDIDGNKVETNNVLNSIQHTTKNIKAVVTNNNTIPINEVKSTRKATGDIENNTVVYPLNNFVSENNVKISEEKTLIPYIDIKRNVNYSLRNQSLLNFLVSTVSARDGITAKSFVTESFPMKRNKTDTNQSDLGQHASKISITGNIMNSETINDNGGVNGIRNISQHEPLRLMQILTTPRKIEEDTDNFKKKFNLSLTLSNQKDSVLIKVVKSKDKPNSYDKGIFNTTNQLSDKSPNFRREVLHKDKVFSNSLNNDLKNDTLNDITNNKGRLNESNILVQEINVVDNLSTQAENKSHTIIKLYSNGVPNIELFKNINNNSNSVIYDKLTLRNTNVDPAKHIANESDNNFGIPSIPITPIHNKGDVHLLKQMNDTQVNITNKSDNGTDTRMKVYQRSVNNVTFRCRITFRGRYADSKDCRKFYICIGKTQPVLGECPFGTVFSNIKKQCTKNLAHCIRNDQFQCIQEGRFSDVLKSNIYYICVKNKNSFVRFKFQCQYGYHFNKTSMRCDNNIVSRSQMSVTSSDNDSTKASDRTTVESRSTEKKKKDKDKNNNVCRHEGKLPDPNDCRRYFVCFKNSRSEFRRKSKKCDSDEVFHPKKQKCVDSDSYECN